MSRQRDRLAALRRRLDEEGAVSFIDRSTVELANEAALGALPVDNTDRGARDLMAGLGRLTEMVGFEQACRVALGGERNWR